MKGRGSTTPRRSSAWSKCWGGHSFPLLVNQASGGDNSADVGDVTDVHAYPGPRRRNARQFPTKAVVCGEFGGVEVWP